METIKERAYNHYPKEGIVEGTGRYAYIKGATEQREIDIEKAERAFCKARCPLHYEACKKGDWKKDCTAYFMFQKEMSNETDD